MDELTPEELQIIIDVLDDTQDMLLKSGDPHEAKEAKELLQLTIKLIRISETPHSS